MVATRIETAPYVGGPPHLENVQRTRCARCGRALRATRSVRNGFGPTCGQHIRSSAVRMRFRTDQVDKAMELIGDQGIVPHSRPGTYVTVSRDGSRTYITTAQACTCPAGLWAGTATRDGRPWWTKTPCYHRVAVALVSRS